MKAWVALAEMFGKAFYREMGTEPPPTWVNTIARLTDDQLVRGLKNLAEDNLSFPPNISQFVSACGRTPPRRFNGVVALPDPNSRGAGRKMTRADKEKAETARMEALSTVGLSATRRGR